MTVYPFIGLANLAIGAWVSYGLGYSWDDLPTWLCGCGIVIVIGNGLSFLWMVLS